MMKHTVLAKITVITLVLILALCDGAMASPIHSEMGLPTENPVDSNGLFAKNNAPESASVTMAKGYLAGFRDFTGAEFALMTLSDSAFPQMVIWDHKKASLKIYNMSENGVAFYCGSIALPEYNGFVWGSQYHVYYQEGKGLLYVEICDDTNFLDEYTVYSIENISPENPIEEDGSVPVIWSGSKECDTSEDKTGGNVRTIYKTTLNDNLSYNAFLEERDQFFSSEDRKLLCGQTMGEGFSGYDYPENADSFMSSAAMYGYLKSIVNAVEGNIKPPADDSIWTTIYLSYFNHVVPDPPYNMPQDRSYTVYDRAEIIYLDDDNIPEILLHPSKTIESLGNVYLDDLLLTIEGDHITEHKMLFSNAYYIPRGNKVYTKHYYEGNGIAEKVISMKDGEEEVHFYGDSGTIMEGDKYLEVTSDEYNAHLNEAFDFSKAREICFDQSVYWIREELRSLFYKSFQEKEYNLENAYSHKLLNLFSGEEGTSTGHEGIEYDYYSTWSENCLFFQLRDITFDGVPELMVRCLGYWHVYTFDRKDGFKKTLLEGSVTEDPVKKRLYIVKQEVEGFPCKRFVYQVNSDKLSLIEGFSIWPENYTLEELGVNEERYFTLDSNEKEQEELSSDEWNRLVEEFNKNIDLAKKRTEESIPCILNIPNIMEMETLFGFSTEDSNVFSNRLGETSENSSQPEAESENIEQIEEPEESEWKRAYSISLAKISEDDKNSTIEKVAPIYLDSDSVPELLIYERHKNYTRDDQLSLRILSLHGDNCIYYGDYSTNYHLAYIPGKNRLLLSCPDRNYISVTGLSDDGITTFFWAYYYEMEKENSTDNDNLQRFCINYQENKGHVSREDYEDLFNSIYDRSKEISVNTGYTFDSVIEMLDTPGKLIPSEKVPDYLAVYAPVLTDIRKAVENGYDYENIDQYKYTSFESGLGERLNYSETDYNLENIGYTIRDINDDNVPELLIGENRCFGSDQTDRRNIVYYGFTCKDEDPVCFLTSSQRVGSVLIENNHFYNYADGGFYYNSFGEFRLNKDYTEFVCYDFYFTDEKEPGVMGYYHNTTGMTDPEEFEELDIDDKRFWQMSKDYCRGMIVWNPIGSYDEVKSLFDNLSDRDHNMTNDLEEANFFPNWKLDKEAEVEMIHEWNKEMLDNRQNYDFHDMGDYSCYTIGHDPLFVIAKTGYNDQKPTRYYYGYTIFYVEVEYSPSKIRKYYYSDERLFRVDTEDGEVIEYGSKNWEKYDEEGKKLAKEQSELFEDIRERLG